MVVGVCLAVSVAVHGVLFGALTFQVPQSASEAPDGTTELVVFQEPAIEVVEIRPVVEPIVLEPIHVQARPAVATSRPEELPQPAPGERSVAKAGEAPPSHAVTGADIPAEGDAFPSTPTLSETGSAARLAMSIRPRLGILEELPTSIRQPVEMLDPLEGSDLGEGDGNDEVSWWQRLGMKFGIGGGKICLPRPELIVDEEKDEEKPDEK
ncbi:MAG: hypothetical protein F4139_04215 [Gemmatimonadetes bacterium]|nr:hypothetical protein [Gemmatimonadota bacterium]